MKHPWDDPTYVHLLEGPHEGPVELNPPARRTSYWVYFLAKSFREVVEWGVIDSDGQTGKLGSRSRTYRFRTGPCHVRTQEWGGAVR